LVVGYWYDQNVRVICYKLLVISYLE
jgi:hypothetical protein